MSEKVGENATPPASPTGTTPPTDSPGTKPHPNALRQRTESSGSLGQRIRALSNAAERIGSGRVNLLAIDSSDHAKNAYEWYLENIHRPDDVVVLVHAPEAPRLPFFKIKSGINPPVDEWRKTIEDVNKKVMQLEEDYSQSMIQKKIKYKMRQETSNKPAEAILKVADDEKADIIVMGSRGTGSVRRAVLGSVSESVLRNSARIPVIIVPKRTLVGEARERKLSTEREKRERTLSGSFY